MSTFNGWTIVTLPTYPPAPKSIEWDFVDTVGVARSPFSLQQQLYNWQASLIRASLSYPQMSNTNATAWRVFFASLQGVSCIFQFGDPMNTAPQNMAATAGAVSGSGQTGYTLDTTSTDLTPGDWIQVGLRLYMVQAVSGGVLGIWPQLRESPATGTDLIITNTQGLFRLTNNDRRFAVSTEQGRTYSFTFEIEEAI